MKRSSKFTRFIALWAMIGVILIACDDGGGTGSGTGTGGSESKWWTWMSPATSDYTTQAIISINPYSNDTACDVSVKGSANRTGYNWATQVCYDYKATVGKIYKVSWKWIAKGHPFDNVTIRYAQQEDYQNDSAYEFKTYIETLTIPTTEESKLFIFTMPANCFTRFVFKVGCDTGSFKIYDFKVEEVSAPFEGTWKLSGNELFIFNGKNFSSKYSNGNYWMKGTWETEAPDKLNITITHMANDPGVPNINDLPIDTDTWRFTYEFMTETSIKLYYYDDDYYYYEYEIITKN